MQNIFRFLKKERIATLFILVVLASFFFHLSHRNEHFQECDSSVVYQIIDSQNSIESTVNDRLLVAEVRSPSNLKEALVSARLKIRSLLLSSPLPQLFKDAVVLPTASTYSPGSGLVYGLATQKNGSYETFMSRATLITLILFHTAVILVFLAGLALGAGPLASAVAAFLMLFSISLYSYGYHLGNTVWNFSTAALWLWFLVSKINKKIFLRNVSILTGILIFFNYLIFFYWIAFLLTYLFLKLKQDFSARRAAKEFFALLKTQIIAIILILICVFLFYPPGQGNRGTASLSTFFSDSYYIVLNFVSFYNHSQVIDIIQFILGFALIALLFKYVIKSIRDNDASPLGIFKKTTFFLLALFVLAVVVGSLGFAPTRHILFLSPILFIFAAVLLKDLLGSHKAWLTIILIALVPLGFASLIARSQDVKSKADLITLDSNVKKVIIGDCAASLRYKSWGSSAPVEFADPKLFSVGDEYDYLSQTTPFEGVLNIWRGKGLDIKARVLNKQEKISDTYFTAHNPRPELLSHTVSNSIYKAKILILGVKKAPEFTSP